MQNKIPAWILIPIIGCAFMLICLISGIAASSNPEPEVITKTKTVEVQNDDQTEQIEELEAQLEICKESTLLASQGMVDVTNAYIELAEGVSELSESRINKSTAMVENIDSGLVGEKGRECDPTISTKIIGLP